MNSTLSTSLKVGITTIISLIILFGGILWLKNFDPMAKKYRMEAVFDDARDIYSGDPVKLSGIKIGEVTDTELTTDNKALVRFNINNLEDIKLSDDTVFIIKDVGLMGDKALVVVPGSGSGRLDHSAVQTGVAGTDISTLIVDAGLMLGRLNSIADKIDSNLDIAALSNDFKQTLEKFQAAIDLYGSIASENKTSMANAIGNFEDSSAGLKKFIVENDTKLGQTIESFSETSGKLSVFIEEMNSIPAVIDTISNYINEDEGTFAKLLKYDDLYEELRQTNADIDSFMVDFKRNPGKYTKDMNFKLRLF